MNRMKKKFNDILILALLFFLSCEDNSILSPEEISKETLLAAPDTIEIGNQKIFLTTYLQRDFMPVSPPDGKPLNAVVYIETVDSSDIPGSLEAQAIYIINGNEVWESFFSDDVPPENSSFRLVKIARDGPKWEPGIYVDVIVLLTIGKEQKLLKASDQYIYRTD